MLNHFCVRFSIHVLAISGPKISDIYCRFIYWNERYLSLKLQMHLKTTSLCIMNKDNKVNQLCMRSFVTSPHSFLTLRAFNSFHRWQFSLMPRDDLLWKTTITDDRSISNPPDRYRMLVQSVCPLTCPEVNPPRPGIRYFASDACLESTLDWWKNFTT